MATKAKYYKVNNKNEQEKTEENEIRVSTGKSTSSYIIRAAVLLYGDDSNKDQVTKKYDSVVLKGTGNAIPTALLASEIIRRKVKGLHQINSIGKTDVEDIFEPKEEGLDRIVQKRVLSLLEIKLTRNPTADDLKAPGYQEPLKEVDVPELTLEQIKNYRNKSNRRDNRGGDRRGGRGGRGGRGNRGGYKRDGGDGRRGDNRRPRSYSEERGGNRDRPQRRYNDRDDRGGDRNDRGGERRQYRGDRDNRGKREYSNDRGGDRNDRGGERRQYRGDRDNRGEYRDRKYDRPRGGDRENRGGDRENRGGDRENRGGDRDNRRNNDEDKTQRKQRGGKQ